LEQQQQSQAQQLDELRHAQAAALAQGLAQQKQQYQTLIESTRQRFHEEISVAKQSAQQQKLFVSRTLEDLERERTQRAADMVHCITSVTLRGFRTLSLYAVSATSRRHHCLIINALILCRSI